MNINDAEIDECLGEDIGQYLIHDVRGDGTFNANCTIPEDASLGTYERVYIRYEAHGKA